MNLEEEIREKILLLPETKSQDINIFYREEYDALRNVADVVGEYYVYEGVVFKIETYPVHDWYQSKMVYVGSLREVFNSEISKLEGLIATYRKYLLTVNKNE